MIVVRESTTVRSPLAALDVLTSREGAKAFRDIREYATYRREADTVDVTYSSGVWGTVHVTMRPRGSSVAFSGSGPLGMSFEGAWEVHRDGTVTLSQTVRGVPGWGAGLVRRRATRAMDDLRAAAT